MIDDTNVTANFSHYHTRDIRTTVRELSDDQKQALLNEIQLQKGVHSLREKPFDRKTCEYVEALLNGERPKNKLS